MRARPPGGSRRASRRGSPPISTRAARPGCRNGSPPRSTLHGTRSASSSAASTALARRSRPAAGPRSRHDGGRIGAADQRADVLAFLRQRLAARLRGGRLAAARLVEEDRADLEQPYVGHAARAVALRDVEQRAEQRRAQHRHVLGHRVAQRHHLAAPVRRPGCAGGRRGRARRTPSRGPPTGRRRRARPRRGGAGAARARARRWRRAATAACRAACRAPTGARPPRSGRSRA